MYRGTTPSISFKINTDLDLTTISECWVTFKAHIGNKEKTFDISDLIINPEEKTITVSMSQDETLFFNTGTIDIQIRLRTNDDLAYASDIKEIRMKKILKDGEI